MHKKIIILKIGIFKVSKNNIRIILYKMINTLKQYNI